MPDRRDAVVLATALAIVAIVAAGMITARRVTAPVGAVLALTLVGLQIAHELRRRRLADAAVRSAASGEVDPKGNARTLELETALAGLKDALSTRATALQLARDAQGAAERANQLKDEFLATVSHELRTPLNAIVGWAHVLKLGGLTDEQHAHAIDVIERNARAQTRLIEDLLDISSMIRGRLNIEVSAVDLRTVVQQAIDTVAPAANARDVGLDVQMNDDSVVIDGDSNRLQQMAWNLVSNAVKFTPKGGQVHVLVDRMGSRARLRVEDSGEGIDAAFLPHMFDTFRQGPSAAMRSGLGLGLAIVRRLVDLHGGAITANSAGLGRGASFVVTFPLHLEPHAGDADAVGAGPRTLIGVRVLIAEDDDDSAAALAAVLRRRGCQVHTARTASECLQALADWHPDVLLCDVGLPDDDGYSLLRRVHSSAEYADIPAIALTAFAGEHERESALAAGFAAHIVKPFNPDAVVHEVASVAPRLPRHD